MDDLISRQAAIDATKSCSVWVTYTKGASDEEEFADNIIKQTKQSILLCLEHDVPSAQPEPKRGKWVKTARWGRVYYCDQCRNYLDFDGVNAGRGSTNYCPNCGADMRGEQDG